MNNFENENKEKFSSVTLPRSISYFIDKMKLYRRLRNVMKLYYYFVKNYKMESCT